jgi:hypothetical protein
MHPTNTSDQPLLPANLLKRIADILEVTDPDSVVNLGKRVERALQEYKAHKESPFPPPKELRQTFNQLLSAHRALYENMNQLGPKELEIIDAAASDFPEVRLARDGLFGMAEATAALEKIGILLRNAQRWLPEVKHGPQRDDARWYLVQRLRVIYATTLAQIHDDGKEEFKLPTRRYDFYADRNYGPFHDFVVAVHEALGFDDPERGVDDLIRSAMGKKPSG